MPAPGGTSPKNFRQLKQAGLDRMSNALVSLEAQFPFNLVPGPGNSAGSADQSGALFGIGRSLYFCIPQNTKLLAYWDTVADRLFKIRNSENIQGMVQQLPLFDPPLDPGHARAGGRGRNRCRQHRQRPEPAARPGTRTAADHQGPRDRRARCARSAPGCSPRWRRAMPSSSRCCGQGMRSSSSRWFRTVRYLQWQHAQETTNGLLKTRAIALERYTYYLRLLGLTPDPATVPATFIPDRQRADRGELRRRLQRAGQRVRPADRARSPTTRCNMRRARHPRLRRARPGRASST